MNLYLIWQEENMGYDTFDSAIVCAENIVEARHIHPSGNQDRWEKENDQWDWVDDPDKVHVKLIGMANTAVEKGVVLASFNAG